MELVAEQHETDWPSDEWWETHLPSWFLDSFQGHTLDQIMSDPTLWDLGSWLDAMKNLNTSLAPLAEWIWRSSNHSLQPHTRGEPPSARHSLPTSTQH